MSDRYIIQAEYRTANEPGYAIVDTKNDFFVVQWYPATREDDAKTELAWWNLPTVRTEDGIEVREGCTVFDYYSMKVGKVGPIIGERRDEYHGPEMQGSIEPWFDVYHEDGKRQILNGQRICSMEAARRKGWV